LELQGNIEEVHKVFERFLEALRRDLDAHEARIVPSATSSTMSTGAAELLGSQGTEIIPPNASFTTQSDDKPPQNKELSEKRQEYGLAWTVYMRFARRAEGLKSARGVFAQARRDKWTPWEVYESAGASLFAYNFCSYKVQCWFFSDRGVPPDKGRSYPHSDLRESHRDL
jgi:cleavage stimulation factor subunit 3